MVAARKQKKLLPQVAEKDTPRTQDAPGECLMYYEYMTRVYLADALTKERLALRLMVLDLKMEIAGESADWPGTLAQVPINQTDMLLVDWALLPCAPAAALKELRQASPNGIVIVLIGHLDARRQAAFAGADTFISKGETPERVADRLRLAATNIPSVK
jgi:DNA-binding NarL/FixJ family response regulator